MKNTLSVVLIATAILAGCGTNVKQIQGEKVEQKTEVQSYLLSIAGDEKVRFSGYVNFDEFSNQNGVSGAMYSGYSAGSFIASVLTHAAISKSIDHARMEKFVEQSNLILQDYQQVIEEFTTSELQEAFFDNYSLSPSATLPLIASVPEFHVTQGTLVVLPEFIMSPDGDTIILENQFDIVRTQPVQKANRKKRARKSQPARPTDHGKKVVVIADAIETAPFVYWNNESGANLRNRSIQLFNESITHFTNYYHTQRDLQTLKQETIKYAIGDLLRIERGTVLQRDCTRVVFSSLRGWIKSVPIHPDYRDEVEGCEGTVALVVQ